MQTDHHSASENAVMERYPIGYPSKATSSNASYAFFAIDHNWMVVYWNGAAENRLGIAAQDIVGHNLKEKCAALLPASFYTIYEQAFLKDASHNQEEYWGAMGDWTEVVSYCDGRSLSVSFKILPITDTRSDENLPLLKTLTEWYRYMSEVTGDALWERNFFTGEMYWIDGGHKRLFGYHMENTLLPESFWVARIHPADKERVLVGIIAATATGKIKVWDAEYRFAKADGSYAYVHDRGHIFYEKNKPLRMIGATQDITQKVMLEKRVEEERQHRQRAATSSVIDMQETERSVIGQVLQEQLSQILVAVKIYLGIVKKYDKHREIYLDKSLHYITEVIDQIRKMHKKLALPNTRMFGLFDNICIYIDDIMLSHPVEIEFWNNNSNDKGFNDNVQINIYRIVQEQLTYLLQYADATRVIISIAIVKDILILYIGDNGIEWAQQSNTSAVPIPSIIHRTELLHGVASVLSKSGEGFILKIAVPLEKNIKV